MDKQGDLGIRNNQWQRLLRWHRGHKANEGGEDGVNDKGKHISLDQKLKVK